MTDVLSPDVLSQDVLSVNHPTPWGEIYANVIWGKKYEKEENVREKERKGRENGRKGKEKVRKL